MNSPMKAEGTSQGKILCLDGKDLWSNSAFQSKLLAALEREGFSQEHRSAVEGVFKAHRPADFESFVRAATEPASSGSSNAERLADVIKHLRDVRAYNISVYSPSGVEDYKRRYWPNNAKLRSTKWEYYEDLYQCDLFVTPKRFITKDTAIASAGSCFAANISRQLQHWGYNYLVEMKQEPASGVQSWEYSTDPAACGNIYNAVSMRQMVERGFGEWVPEKLLVSTSPKFVDPFRAYVDYADFEGYEKRWNQHNAALGRALRKCEVFVLTLGMTEAWLLADSGLATSTAPRKCDPTLFRYKDLSVEENVRELERIGDLFRVHNPNAKIIATVSPVPLNATFHKDQHVVVANGLSKATLRVALDIVCKRRPDQFIYFPSYEIVVTATRDPWEIDLRHVSDHAIRRVMHQFQKMLMVDQSPLNILSSTPIESVISQRRSYAQRYARKYVIHPIKRKLGIEGRPFRDLWRTRGAT